MNVISMSLFAIACVAFVSGGYVCLFRWDGTPPWLRWGLWCVGLLFAAGACCLRTPALFGSESGFQCWLRKFSRRGGLWSDIDCERQFQKVQGQILGEYVRSQVKGEKCVILCAPELKNLQGEGVEDMTVAGVREGLGEAFREIQKLEVPMDRPSRVDEEGELRTGLPDRAWTVDALTELLTTAGKFDVLIACVPLPEECFAPDGELQCEALQGKAIGLCAGAWGGARKAVAGGGVLAAVGYAPEATCREKICPAETREAFALRYVLMTRKGDVTYRAVDSEH